MLKLRIYDFYICYERNINNVQYHLQKFWTTKIYKQPFITIHLQWTCRIKVTNNCNITQLSKNIDYINRFVI